jgi:geranylgeranyl pyrophosphate synthase
MATVQRRVRASGRRQAAALEVGDEDVLVRHGHARQRPALAGLIEREFSEAGDLAQALDLVRGSSAIQRSRTLAESFANEAHDALTWLPPSDSRSALLELPEFVLSRLY